MKIILGIVLAIAWILNVYTGFSIDILKVGLGFVVGFTSVELILRK